MHRDQALPVAADLAGRALNALASDEALIGRVALGDELAMEALFTRHRTRATRFVLRLVRDQALAEDLTSDMFLEVWRKAGRFEARCAGATWLMAIAQFKALSALRRRTDEAVDDAMVEAVEDPADDPELALSRRCRSEVLRECLIALSPKHREVIDLVYFDDHTIKEAAAIVGSPENTVKTRMFHARKHLSELLDARGVDNSDPRYH